MNTDDEEIEAMRADIDAVQHLLESVRGRLETLRGREHRTAACVPDCLRAAISGPGHPGACVAPPATWPRPGRLRTA